MRMSRMSHRQYPSEIEHPFFKFSGAVDDFVAVKVHQNPTAFNTRLALVQNKTIAILEFHRFQ
jgi:hypothetical protein